MAAIRIRPDTIQRIGETLQTFSRPETTSGDVGITAGCLRYHSRIPLVQRERVYAHHLSRVPGQSPLYDKN